MSNFQRLPQEGEAKDPELWELAQARAGFKRHLLSFVLVIAFLWILWLITGARTSGSGIPWPAWATLGWGIGLTAHYLGVYVYPKSGAAEREYEQLKRKQK